MNATWFDQLQQQLSQQVTPHLEKGLVSLGVLSAEDVGDGVGLSTAALTRRFGKEARELKDWRKGSGYMGSCTNPEVSGGGGGGMGPSPAMIDETFDLWKKRLEYESGDNAVDALLQSQALNLVLPALTSTRNGRVALKDAADPNSPRPLRAILTRVSAVPDAFLGRVLQLLVEATEVAEQNSETGMSDEAASVEKGLQWVQHLLSASLLDILEAAQRTSGIPVEVVISALTAIDAPPACSAPEERLDAAEYCGRSYNDVKGICEIFTKSPSAATISDASEKMLKATAEQLANCEVSMARIQALKVPKVRKVLLNAAAVAQEVQAMLRDRMQKAKLVRFVLPELMKSKHLTGVAAVCLEAERMRSRHLEEVHAVLHGILWGPKADLLWQDAQALPSLRYLTNRMSVLVDMAWREMVQLAAETLDDNNALSANSELMSNAAARYKEMRAELHKNSSRLAKMEQAASSAGLKSAAASNAPGISAALQTDSAPVASPSPGELAAAAQRQEVILALRTTLEGAASGSGVPLPVAAKKRPAPPSNAPRSNPSMSSNAASPVASASQSAVAPKAKAQAASPAAAVPRQPETPEAVKAEIAKYVGAIACFLRYKNVPPVFKHWEDSQADSLAYWKDKPATEQGLLEVGGQARGAFYDAVKLGVSPQSLACGLHRAVARFRLSEHFKQFVQPTVSEILKQMGSSGIVAEPSSGPSEEYYEACEENVMLSAIAELQKSKVIPANFKWVPQPSARFLKLLDAEIEKYAGAVAYFMRYEKGPLFELWQNARKDGLVYWKQTPCAEQELPDVAKQAKEGFDDAVVGGLTSESLATALGRAVMRFLLVEKFREPVQASVTSARQRVGRGSKEEPESGADDEFHSACQSEVMEGAIGELQSAKLIELTAEEKQRRNQVEDEAKRQMTSLEQKAIERRRNQREAEIAALRAKADPDGKQQEAQAADDTAIRERLRPSLNLALGSGELSQALAAMQDGGTNNATSDLAASVDCLEASVVELEGSASAWGVASGRWRYEGKAAIAELPAVTPVSASTAAVGEWQVSDGRWQWQPRSQSYP